MKQWIFKPKLEMVSFIWSDFLFFAEFMKVYERLDIKNLVNRGESFYQEMMKDVVADLDKRGM